MATVEATKTQDIQTPDFLSPGNENLPNRTSETLNAASSPGRGTKTTTASGFSSFGEAVDLPPTMAARLEANARAKANGQRWGEFVPGTGWVWHGPMSEEERARRQADTEGARISALRRSGVPTVFLSANFETNNRGEPLVLTESGGSYRHGTHRAHRVCRSLSERWKPGYTSPQGYSGVVLQSPGFGLGKSYLLCAVLAAAQRRGYKVGFTRCEDLLMRYRSTFGNVGGVGQSAEQIFEEYAAVPLLVLDELGGDYIKTGEAGEWARTQFLRLLDCRLDRGLTTLGTTNVTKADLTSHYGGRMVSRLLAGSLLLPMDGPDFRQVGASGTRIEEQDDPFAETGEEVEYI